MRDAILRAAGHLFAEHGVEQVSLDEIAATVGITTRQLRAYFTSTIGIHEAMAHGKGGGDVLTSSNLVG